MNTQKYKILITSLGSIGKRHLANTRFLLPNAVIGVLRQPQINMIEVPDGADFVFTSLEDAISFSPDALIIASPANLHLEYAYPFISNGTPVFIEKPLSINSEGLEAFINFAEKSDSFAMIGYVLRFLPALNAIKTYLEGDDLGTIYHAHIQVGQYLPDWRPNSDYRQGVSAQAKLGGGALLELSHELDYATWLFGQPDSLYCRCHKVSDLDIDVEDSAHILFEYDSENNRKTVAIQLDFLQRTPQMTLQIVGSKATLKSDLIKETITIYDAKNTDGTSLQFCPSENGNEPYLRQFDYFFDRSFDDYTARYRNMSDSYGHVDLDQGIKVINLIEKAKESNQKGIRL